MHQGKGARRGRLREASENDVVPKIHTETVLDTEADYLRVIIWWVDASYAVHPDMRSHTGSTETLGKDSVYSTSTRQKLNKKSSTEAEMVGADDLMPQVLWTQYFIEAQGYGIDDNFMYQDNQSTMQM